jgi:outer membrane beta-barrel protein
MKRFLQVAFLGLALVATSGLARAERQNPLEGQPAIRHRLELRDMRFEITPFMGFTMLEDFNNTIMGGGKLQYHINDWFSIGGLFAGGASIDTGLKKQVLSTLTDNAPTGPMRAAAENAMNRITWMAAGQAEFTPFAGKLSLFSKGFFNYDFYIDGGVGFVQLDNNISSPSLLGSPGNTMMPSNTNTPTGAGNDCSSNAKFNAFGCNTGLKTGPTVAIGVHMFFNDSIALNLEYRAIIIKDNSAGRDVNGDMTVNDDDLSISTKSFVTIGLAFFLPLHPDISP